MGNRVSKVLNTKNKTFYTRDAQGNVLSIYENGKQKKYRDTNGNIYYFNAQNELIGFTNANGDNLFQWHIKGKLIFEGHRIFVCIVKIEQDYGNCNDKIQLTDITDENLITQTEVPIYGSDRIGTYNPQEETNINSDIYILNRSYKRYELKDHLGNVRVTVSDSKRVSFVSETLVFSADIKTYTDYYAFGMEMVGRNWSESEVYRQGYNGKENDKDFGEGVQDYGMRVSDTQVARFFSVDPITAQYPELTPYQFASNTPIQAIDLDGLEAELYYDFFVRNGTGLLRPTFRYVQNAIARRMLVTRQESERIESFKTPEQKINEKLKKEREIDRIRIQNALQDFYNNEKQIKANNLITQNIYENIGLAYEDKQKNNQEDKSNIFCLGVQNNGDGTKHIFWGFGQIAEKFDASQITWYHINYTGTGETMKAKIYNLSGAINNDKIASIDIQGTYVNKSTLHKLTIATQGLFDAGSKDRDNQSWSCAVGAMIVMKEANIEEPINKSKDSYPQPVKAPGILPRALTDWFNSSSKTFKVY